MPQNSTIRIDLVTVGGSQKDFRAREFYGLRRALCYPSYSYTFASRNPGGAWHAAAIIVALQDAQVTVRTQACEIPRGTYRAALDTIVNEHAAWRRHRHSRALILFTQIGPLLGCYKAITGRHLTGLGGYRTHMGISLRCEVSEQRVHGHELSRF